MSGFTRACALLFVDVRLALRSLRRDRSFALAAIGTLALAISLNAIVFTVADAMLFRGYPHVRQNERVVYLQERSAAGLCCISYLDFEDWRAQARTFEGMAFVASNRQITFRDGNGRPSDLVTFLVSPNTFALLGVAPLLGRDFTAADAVPGAPQVAMLNHRFWSARFARRADVIGSAVEINGMPATIIGVMPEGFDFPTRENLWMPIVPSPDLLQRGLTPGGFIAAGRLHEGVSRIEAQAELETINRRLAAAYPATNRNLIPTVLTHSQANSGEDAQIIWGSVWAGAWFVLLIACANLANLTIVRTMRRWRELATRIALGAGQTRMMRLMLIEGVLLAALAAGISWWITIWSVRVWAETTASQYQVLDYTVDSRTLVYLLGISVLAAILISLGAMVRVAQLGASGALKGDARGVTQSLRGKHLAAGLVGGQMALAIILLSGAGVLTRSLANIVRADSGVRAPEHVLVGATRLPTDKYPSDSTRRTYYDELQTRLRAVQGVETVSMASAIPVQSMVPRLIEVDGRPRTLDNEESVAFVRAGTDYFRALGLSSLVGRTFEERDGLNAAPVALVNESFAARFWPGEDPIGKRLRGFATGQSAEWRTVVGVVPNIKQNDPLRQRFLPIVYVPFLQEAPRRLAYFLIRTATPAEHLAAEVRREVQRVDPDVAIEDFETLQASFRFQRDYMDARRSELGKHAEVAPVFALIAMLLAAVGLGAVIAHSVNQRTKEIGVRVAIGAVSWDVRWLILREGMVPVALGLIAGLVMSLAVNRILQSQLVGVSPYDPMTMTIAPALLVMVALLSCHVPIRRALRIDPVVALQEE